MSGEPSTDVYKLCIPTYRLPGDPVHRPRGTAFARRFALRLTPTIPGSTSKRGFAQDTSGCSPCPETQTDAALDAARSRVSPVPGPVYLGSASHADGRTVSPSGQHAFTASYAELRIQASIINPLRIPSSRSICLKASCRSSSWPGPVGPSS